MTDLINVIKAHVRGMLDQQAVTRYGIVTSVDAARHRLKVELQPEGTPTSWLPLLVHAAGAGWGMSMLPQPGMQVAVSGLEGTNSNLIVLGAVHSTDDRPPLVANAIGNAGTLNSGVAPPVAGEMIATHPSGTTLRLCADGTVYIRGNVGIDGTLRVNGDVFDQHGSLDRLRQHYNAHSHPDPQGGIVGTTTAPDPE